MCEKRIDELLNEDYIIVLDTNVYLDIYRYFPNYSEYAIMCLNKVVDKIYIPSIVRIEYLKHHKAYFNISNKRVEKVIDDIEDSIKKAKNTALKIQGNLQKLQFPNLDSFLNELSLKFDGILKETEEYFENNSELVVSSQFWGDEDKVKTLFNTIESYKHLMPELSVECIYRYCDEGEKRYKKKTPPGFKDEKDKKGVNLYSDFFIWKEILAFATMNKKNVIFVTGDVKADWWENDSGTRKFHSKLRSEFSKTGQQIIAFETNEFYSEISRLFSIDKPDSVDLASVVSDKMYCETVYDEVVDFLYEKLEYDAINYIEESSSNIGSEGIEDFCVNDCTLKSYKRIDRDDDLNITIYEMVVNVVVEGVSFEYCGKDPDTREIILSPGRYHEFEGEITINIERKDELFFDLSDNDYTSIEIMSGELIQTSFKDRWETDCGPYGNCAECGAPLYDDNNGTGGFCINCFNNH